MICIDLFSCVIQRDGMTGKRMCGRDGRDAKGPKRRQAQAYGQVHGDFIPIFWQSVNKRCYALCSVTLRALFISFP